MVAALFDIFGPGLYIDEAPDDVNFMSQARISLNILRSRDCGEKLLKAICDACKTTGFTVVIEKDGAATAIPTTDTSPGFRTRLREPGNGILVDDAFALTANGKGCCGIARWNPANTIPGTNIERPAYLSLAHELIHCLHYLTGDCARPPTRRLANST
jgi:Effector protein